MPRISCQPQCSLRQKKTKNCCSSNCLRVIYLSQLHKRTWGPARTKHKSPAYCENPMLLMLRSWLIKCSCLSSFSAMLGFFFLPPSLSLTSVQAVSMDVSQPAPLQPSWHTQYQPLLPRVHLPFPLHNPGQPSVWQHSKKRTGILLRSN